MDDISALTKIWIPDWAIGLIGCMVAVLIGIVTHRFLFRVLAKFTRSTGPFLQSLVKQLSGPARLAIIIATLSVAANLIPLTSSQASILRSGLLICFIALLGWCAVTALDIWTTLYLGRFKLDSDDNMLARKHVTQTTILRRAMDILIVLVTVGAALMTVDGVRQYGVSLLASAGAAGIVVGLALQPLLKNLLAGIQLAIAQPIRIEDAVIVEGEWGNVEDITATYVVVRIWDWRRLIVPLSYFIEKPFQNWTRDGAALIGTVMIYLDYTVPVDAVRRKVEEIAENSKLWDRKVVAVQVTDFKDTTMEIRILISALNAPRTFDLRCEMREKLINFLQENFPNSLPRQRMEVSGDNLQRVFFRDGAESSYENGRERPLGRPS